MARPKKWRWRDLKFIAPVVLCFVVPIVVFAALIPLAQLGETTSASTVVPETIDVGTRKTDFRQAVGVTFVMNKVGVVTSNASGRITAVAVIFGEAVTSGTKLYEVNGAPVFAMPQSPPLYRDLAEHDKGTDVAAMQQFLIAAGLLSDTTAHRDGVFGSETADGVSRFQKANGLERTEVFSMSNVAYIPAGVTAVGATAKSVGDTVMKGDPVLSGAPAPASVVFKSSAENGVLTAYGTEPVVVSTSSGAEIVVPSVSNVGTVDTVAIYTFVQTAITAGDIVAPETAKGQDSGDATSVSVTGLILRKEASSVFAVVPGNSVLVSKAGNTCVIAVDTRGSRSAVRLSSTTPAVGQLGQVFTDAEIGGRVILRDPTSATSKVQAECK